MLSNGTEYSRLDQVRFVEDSLQKIWRDMVCLSRRYPFKFFKGCLPQVLLGPLLNTLSQIKVPFNWPYKSKSLFFRVVFLLSRLG